MVKIGNQTKVFVNSVRRGASTLADGARAVDSAFASAGKRVKKIPVNKVPTTTRVPTPPKFLKKKPSAADTWAKKLDFADEDEFYKFVRNFDARSPKHLSRGRGIAKFMRKNVKSMALVGSTAAIILYLQHYQNLHSGCFRYLKAPETEEGYEPQTGVKMMGDYCVSSSSVEGEIPAQEHPLYYVEKWDCDCDAFDDSDESVRKIRSEGCLGLCNLENYNTMAAVHELPGKFHPVDTKEDHQYVYKCQRVTFLQALNENVEEVTNQIADSALGEQIYAMFQFKRLKMMVCLLFIVGLVYLACSAYGRVKEQHQQKIAYGAVLVQSPP